MDQIRKRPGAKKTKKDRCGEYYRIDLELPPRLEYLKAERQKIDPKTSLSDLVNEAIENPLDAEMVPKDARIDKARIGVEL